MVDFHLKCSASLECVNAFDACEEKLYSPELVTQTTCPTSRTSETWPDVSGCQCPNGPPLEQQSAELGETRCPLRSRDDTTRSCGFERD